MNLSILYRGSLVSCNYACDYCPFAKRAESWAEMERDRAELERFVAWVTRREELRLRVLFTPWGEALIRPWYQEALVALSNLPHVERVAIQTNLSAPLEWLARADLKALALWTTYHPQQVSRQRFVARCHELDRRGVRYSVGLVGLREHFAELEALRVALAPGVSLWVNAYKRDPGYYTAAEQQWLAEVDPHFPTNARYHVSRGLPCRTGERVISVDGAGDVRRCHFVPALLGNIYAQPLESMLRPRPCSAERCGCYIGYAHLEPLGLDREFGDGLLERIPLSVTDRAATPAG